MYIGFDTLESTNVVTITGTSPDPDEVRALISVSLISVMDWAEVVPNITLIDTESIKLVPVIVTSCPPIAGPMLG